MSRKAAPGHWDPRAAAICGTQGPWNQAGFLVEREHDGTDGRQATMGCNHGTLVACRTWSYSMDWEARPGACPPPAVHLQKRSIASVLR